MTSKKPNPVVDSVTETVADSASHARSAKKPVRIKNKLKAGGNIKIDDDYFDGILLDNDNL